MLAVALNFWSREEKSLPLRCIGVAESSVHRSMNVIVRGELERERYAVVEEPLYPPGKRVSWYSYRPDLLGYRSQDGTEELVLVECETHPNVKRFASKNYSSVWFQPFLFRKGSVRKILAVPQGRLRGVDLGIRGSWEIWVLGDKRPVEKIRTTAKNPTPSEAPRISGNPSKS